MFKKNAILIPAALSVAMFAYLSIHYTINIPLWDDFDLVLNFLNSYLNTHAVHEKLWALTTQHNEHRILIPKLICLIYFKIFGQVNFKNLVFCSQAILILIIPTYFAMLKTINKNNQRFNLVVAFILVLCPNTAGSFVWLGAALQQNMQMLFSLLIMVYFYQYEILNKAWILVSVLLLMILNVFTGGGWITLSLAYIIYTAFRRRWKFFALFVLFNTSVCILYFKILPYTFLPHKFTSIADLIVFILGFTGSTFFGNKFSFIIGVIIICVIVKNYKTIISNNLLLIWFLFFFLNALTIGVSRMANSQGLDDRYAIYSLINLGFVLKLLIKNNNLRHSIEISTIWLLLLLSIYSFYNVIANGIIEKRKEAGLYSIHYPLYIMSEAINTYQESKKTGIFKSSTLDNNIKNMNPIHSLKLTNNIPLKANLEYLEMQTHFLSLGGWAFNDDFSIKNSAQFLMLNAGTRQYWFRLFAVNRPDISAYFKTKYDQSMSGFQGVLNIATVKPGKYNMYIYVTNGRYSGERVLKKNVQINNTTPKVVQ